MTYVIFFCQDVIKLFNSPNEFMFLVLFVCCSSVDTKENCFTKMKCQECDFFES